MVLLLDDLIASSFTTSSSFEGFFAEGSAKQTTFYCATENLGYSRKWKSFKYVSQNSCIVKLRNFDIENI